MPKPKKVRFHIKINEQVARKFRMKLLEKGIINKGSISNKIQELMEDWINRKC